MKYKSSGWFLVEKSSRPARGAWVEIHDLTSHSSISDVAPRKGRVG